MGGSMTCIDNDVPVDQRSTEEQDGTIYHEKQSRELCALHAINNLFQDEVFTKHDFDSICYKLSPDTYVNPHKSMFGLGNYDVNVIMSALQARSYDTVWFDKRRDISGLAMENIFGFILNIPMDYKWGILHLPLRRKHWIVIRRIGRNYYNLDSKLEAPMPIGNSGDLIRYLRDQMICKEKELLLVVSQSVSMIGSWWRTNNTYHEKDRNGGINLTEKSDQEMKKAPLANKEDDQSSRELELTIDCRIVPGEAVEKPMHLKKYHHDYVPIEIHRTYTKKDALDDFDLPVERMPPVDVEPIKNDSIDYDTGKYDTEKYDTETKESSMNGHVNKNGLHESSVLVVKQAKDAL